MLVGLTWVTSKGSLSFGEINVGKEFKHDFTRRIKTIEMCDNVENNRDFKFYDQMGLYINRFTLKQGLFPTYKGKQFTIPESFTLVGLSLVTDDTGAITWLNFNVQKNDWF